MSNPTKKFQQEVEQRIVQNAADTDLVNASKRFMEESARAKYSYNFSWLGRPIIQYPQDMIAMQEIIWKVQPDLIVETGIAHGGSLVFFASMLELNAACGGSTKAGVLGIDIDIRKHNRVEIEQHPMYRRINMIEGSSIDRDVFSQVKQFCTPAQKVLICLDSNHTHQHVLSELNLYAPLTSVGSYCVVFDTIIENLDADQLHGRPWKKGDSPMSAVEQFVDSNPDFVIDQEIDSKLLISVCPRGFLRRLS